MSNISKLRGLVALACGQANQNGISLLDVKSLYDDAFAEKARARACLRSFRIELARAERLDAAYRHQLVREPCAPRWQGGVRWRSSSLRTRLLRIRPLQPLSVASDLREGLEAQGPASVEGDGWPRVSGCGNGALGRALQRRADPWQHRCP